MENLPVYIFILFALTLMLTLWLFYKATNHSMLYLFIILSWLIIQTIISISGFYTSTATMPPRFALLISPPLLFIVILFLTKKGKRYIDSLNPALLTLLHIIRIPVEIVLYWLCLQKVIPSLMTFEGRNFDIISGLTAPLVYYAGYRKKQINKKIILAWNFICLALLINIVILAVLSAPFPFQKFAFDQPNIAILYFPFTLLACGIVPLVLFSHLAIIRHLLHKKS